MATIRTRVHNRHRPASYQVQIRRKGFPPISKTFPTLALAREWSAKLEYDLARTGSGLAPVAESVTFGDALKAYLCQRCDTGSKDKSLGKRLAEELGSYHLQNITPKILSDLRDTLLSEGKAPQTVKHHLGLVSRVYSTAIKRFHTYSGDNPVRRIEMPSVANTGRDTTVDRATVDRITTGLSVSAAAFIQLAYETGMRRGEIERIELGHIDQVNRTLLIPITKTGKPRTIPLSPNGLEAAKQLATDLIAGDVVSRIFKARAKKLGLALDHVRFHDLRHSAITRFFEMGLGHFEVAAISGHTTMAMLKRYTHISASHLATKLGYN